MKEIPNWDDVKLFIKELNRFLIPKISESGKNDTVQTSKELNSILEMILKKTCQNSDETTIIIEEFQNQMNTVSEILYKDAKAIYQGDPAAHSIEEVIICYPGFYAILLHRIAHILWNKGIKIFPRMIAEYAHSKTGIDIHPGANIGQYFCIDHGTGVVIGESTIIGNNVKIYQGVTLGALSVSKDKAGKKRHPTIGDNVCIYSRTTILGGDTHIGENSIIGGNVWLTQSVAPRSIVLNKSETILKYDEKDIQNYTI